MSILDTSSGAAKSTRDLLALLTAHGWTCGAVCGPYLEFEEFRPIRSLFRDQGLSYEEQQGRGPGVRYAVLHAVVDGVSVAQFAPDFDRARSLPTRSEAAVFLDLAAEACETIRPEMVITYADHPVTRELAAKVRRAGIRVVFSLRNLSYRDPSLFWNADAILVPSEAARCHYLNALGLEAVAIPGPFDWNHVKVDGGSRTHLTFVNPQASKGSLWFVRIAEILARRRPDIPILVVEGRGGASLREQAGLSPGRLPNVTVMAHTSDPRHFYQRARVVAVPSLVAEAFPRVAVEALLNGIPVLGSDRGGIPETLARSGTVVPIPACCTPKNPGPPTEDEVGPWLAAIERLWDDPSHYAAESRRATAAAEEWRPEKLYPRIEAFFTTVREGHFPK